MVATLEAAEDALIANLLACTCNTCDTVTSSGKILYNNN